MPLQPSIIILPADMVKIQERLVSKQFTSSPVQIVDMGNNYALRDINGHLISYIDKTIQPTSDRIS
jgi:hypothetical protein